MASVLAKVAVGVVTLPFTNTATRRDHGSRGTRSATQKPKTESGNDSVKPRRCRHEPTLHVTRRGGRVLCKFMRFQLRALTALVHRSVCPPRPPTLGSSHDRSALCLAVSYSP